MGFSFETMPNSKTILTTAVSLTASVIFLQTINNLIPIETHNYFFSRSLLRKLSNCLSSQLTIVIEEFDDDTSNHMIFDDDTSNHMFDAANVYLGTKVSSSTQRIKVNKPEKDEELAITVDKNQEILDCFQGIKFNWVLQCTPIKNATKSSDKNPNPKSELRYFELGFHKKHREMVLKTYLPYILQKSKEIKDERKAVKLHTVDYNGSYYWGSVGLNHPATFDTMAMDPNSKRELIEDLDLFIRRKDYYRRVGKAWKRGYLLYGPPGTGKSSLIAAMANYLKFDVYDLDLRRVDRDSDLRRLLIGPANRSILVIEDIACNVGLQHRDYGYEARDKPTPSGLLNFIDGLWSSCGDERIIVFTTNSKDHLDPALLRPGRMDVHLEMSYCTFSGFKILASNYLKIDQHTLFGMIEDLLGKVRATPAEVAKELMKSENAEVALQSLINRLQANGPNQQPSKPTVDVDGDQGPLSPLVQLHKRA